MKKVSSATVVSTATDYAHRIQAGRYELVADEPPALGGQGAGPAPFDLDLASLAACTAITLRMYAQRRAGISANSAPSCSCPSTKKARCTCTACCTRPSRSAMRSGSACWKSSRTRR